MKFVVIGSGGVGGYFGGKLARSGEDVWFIARGEHLAAMQRHGLRISAGDETFVIPPGKMTDDISAPGPADVVLFCVKSYDTEAAAAMLAPIVTDRTVIICLQNGVDNEEKIQKLIPRGTVYGGAAYVYATVTAPGVITHGGTHKRIVFGPMGQGDERTQRIRDVLTRAGLRVDYTEDILSALWTKFVFITGVGGTTALTRLSLGEILPVPAAHKLLECAMRETLSVAMGLKLDIAENIVDRMFVNLATMSPNTYSSMYHDLVNGRPLEIEAFSGIVIRYAQQLGITTPTHDVIYAALLPHHLKNLRNRGG